LFKGFSFVENISSTVDSSASRVTLDDLVALADRAAAMLEQVRAIAFAPEQRKKAPIFSSGQLASLCNIDKNQFNYRLRSKGLPSGQQREPRSSREFTLEESMEWIKFHRTLPVRQPEQSGFVVTVANFKGGVSKTTTAVALAQGLTLRGHRVLLIDADPQGSATTFCGFLPDAEVDVTETLSPLFHGKWGSDKGEQNITNLEYAIRETYWSGLDLVPASPALFGAEFALPARQMSEKDFRFWDVLLNGLTSVQKKYDVIIIDTPPSMSYITLNALLAADGLIIPIPPKSPDYASSAQFWRLFTDLASSIRSKMTLEKSYAFVSILLSRVDMSKQPTSVVRAWISKTYGDRVLPVQIPQTAVAEVASIEFGTVYDITKYSGSNRTYERAREAYDQFVDLMDQMISQSWTNPDTNVKRLEV
jgi:chromosome partitioning protein